MQEYFAQQRARSQTSFLHPTRRGIACENGRLEQFFDGREKDLIKDQIEFDACDIGAGGGWSDFRGEKYALEVRDGRLTDAALTA